MTQNNIEKLITWMEERDKLYHKIASAKLELNLIIAKAKSLQEEDGWISVEDRLPEPYINVLICWSKESKGMHPIMSTARWVGDSWSTDKTKPILPTTITHWQPLPEKPKQQ